MSSNLPDDCTDKMIDDHFGPEPNCPDCGQELLEGRCDFEDCHHYRQSPGDWDGPDPDLAYDEAREK